MSFIAAYSGTRCGLCDEQIVEGDRVAYEDGELCHDDCVESLGDAA